MSIIKSFERHDTTNALRTNVGDWVQGEIRFSQETRVEASLQSPMILTNLNSMGLATLELGNYDWAAEGWGVGDIMSCASTIQFWYEQQLPGGAWILGGLVPPGSPGTGFHGQSWNFEISAINGQQLTLAIISGAPFFSVFNLNNPTLGFEPNPTLLPGAHPQRHLGFTALHGLPARLRWQFQTMIATNQTIQNNVEFEFNLPPDGSLSTNSVIDGEVNKFTALNTGIGQTAMVPGNNKSGGIFKDVTVERTQSGFASAFTIKYKYMQWGFVQPGTINPTYYNGAGQLVPVTRIKTSNINGAVDTFLTTSDNPNDSVGFYDESLNNGINPFTKTGIQWTDSLGNPITALNFSGTSNFKAQITGPSQNSDHRFRIGLIWRPEDQGVYSNRPEGLGNSLLLNAPENDFALSTTPDTTVYAGLEDSTGAKWDLTNIKIESVGPGIEVSGTVIPNAACTNLFGAIPDGSRKSTLWISLGEEVFPDPNSSGDFLVPTVGRVSLRLFDEDNIDAPVLGVQIPDVIEEKLLDHGGNDITDFTNPNTTTEDDVLYRSAFLLPDNLIVEGLRARIYAYDESVSPVNEFIIDTGVFIDFSNIVIQNGQYQPIFNQSRNFNLPPTTDRNHISLVRKPSIDIAGKYGLELEYGFLNDWRYWLNQNNAHGDFFDPNPNTNPVPSSPDVNDNNGKNKNWQRFSTIGNWKLRVSYFLIKDGISDFNHLPFKIRPYEDDADVSLVTTIKELVGNTIVTTPLEDRLHEITAVFTWNQNFADEWVEFTIEDHEGGNRWVMSSVHDQGGVGSNPFKPITGETAIQVVGNGTMTLTCKANLNTVGINVNKISISYRVYSSPNGHATVVGGKQKTDGSYKQLTNGNVKLKA